MQIQIGDIFEDNNPQFHVVVKIIKKLDSYVRVEVIESGESMGDPPVGKEYTFSFHIIKHNFTKREKQYPEIQENYNI